MSNSNHHSTGSNFDLSQRMNTCDTDESATSATTGATAPLNHPHAGVGADDMNQQINSDNYNNYCSYTASTTGSTSTSNNNNQHMIITNENHSSTTTRGMPSLIHDEHVFNVTKVVFDSNDDFEGIPPPPPQLTRNSSIPVSAASTTASTTSTSSTTATTSASTMTILTPSTTLASVGTATTAAMTENDAENQSETKMNSPLRAGSDSVPTKDASLQNNKNQANDKDEDSNGDDKDLRDCLTPEALIRAASSSSSYMTCKITNQSRAPMETQEQLNPNGLTSTTRTTVPQVHNAVDKEGLCEDGEDEEEDPEKLLASVPPELIRTSGNPASSSSTQPGAYHHYNSIGMTPTSTGRNTREEGSSREEEGENFLIEATLVTDEMNHNSNGSSNVSPQQGQLPVEQAPSPVVMIPQPPIYNAHIVDESDLVESQTRDQRLEPFSISNTILSTRGNGHVVISKTKLRCIIYVFILLLGISILSITLPLVLRDEDDRGKSKRESKNLTRDDWDRVLLRQKQLLLLRNYENYKFVTHHVSVITIRNHPNNMTSSNTGSRSATICSPLYDAHEINGYVSVLEEVEARNIENHDASNRFLRNEGRKSSNTINDITDDRSHRHRQQQRSLSDNGDASSEHIGDAYFDDFVDFDGVVVTLTCGSLTPNNNNNDDLVSTTPSIILLHNEELSSPSFVGTFDTDQWNTGTNTDVNRIISVDIPLCSNVLFPPAEHNDDALTSDENAKNQQGPENIFDSVDPMIYGTYQCRIFPKSPYNDLVEQFVFVYTCASSSDVAVPIVTDSHSKNEYASGNVSSMHIRNVVTTCLSSENTNVAVGASPPTITSISMSMQRLCRGNSTNGDDLIVPFQPQPKSGKNITAVSSSSSASSYLCRASDGSMLDTIYHNISAATNSSKYFEYCTSSLDVDPFTTGNSRIVESDIQLWCGPNDDYDTDDADFIEFCDDIRNSTTYDFYEYVVPNVTMIDSIPSSNININDSHNTALGSTSNQCSFGTLMSSFLAMVPVSETGTVTTSSSHHNNDIVLPTISILGNGHYSNDSNTGNTLAMNSTVVAMNLREIILNLIKQQQQ